MTAAAVELQRVYTTDEVVELAWERVFSGEFKDIASSVRDLWPSLHLAEDDLAFLALFGLIEVARKEQRGTRAGSADRPAIGWGSPHGKKWDRYIALTWAYEGSDGTKALLDFNLSDLTALAVASATQAAAFTRRAEWARVASDALQEHGVTRVRDLPAAALAELNAAASEAMGRQK